MENTRKTVKYYSKSLRNGRRDPDFFEFVRRIEQACGEQVVGRSSCFTAEPVRFGQMPHLHFPETVIAEISERDWKTLIFVYFMGLTGVNGPMPLEFTNYVFQRSHNYYDLTLRRFLDIINHRFIGLFYRAWKANEQAAQFDHKADDLITQIIRALAGDVLPDGIRRALPEHTEAYWCGLFGIAVKSKSGLEELLCGDFKLPLKVIDLVIGQSDIPENYRCRLGDSETAVLGTNLQLGSRFYSNTRKFIVEIGPVDFEICRFMLPGTTGFRDLAMLVNRYLDRPLEYDLRFILYTETLPQARLNNMFQLGRNIWLGGGRTSRKYTVLTLGASRLAENWHRKSFHKSNRGAASWEN